MSTFGDWLAEEIRARAWSHNELARQADLSQPAVSGIIGGRRPSCEFCVKVAAALSVSPVMVLTKAGIIPPESLEDDPALQELLDAARLLSPEGRQEVLTYIRFRLQQERK